MTAGFSRDRILNERGLGVDPLVRKYIAKNVRDRCERRVPLRTGRLRDSAEVSADGRSITYNVPYAKYQYAGVSGRGKPLNYNGAPMRGGYWDRRMAADEGAEIAADVKAYIGGLKK